VFILKGKVPLIEIETDENLHDIILFTIDNNGILKLNLSHHISSKKKLSIRVTVTEEFNSIILSDKAIVNSLIDLELDKINIVSKGSSKVFLTAKTNEFNLTAEKYSKIELNLNTQKSTIKISESSDLKALINATELNVDLYQKANAKIEGDIDLLKLRVDNAANFEGKKLTTNNAIVIAEGSADCYIDVIEILTIDALGSSKIYVYNSPKINLNKFGDSATIYKK